jgi:hypothetical protein
MHALVLSLLCRCIGSGAFWSTGVSATFLCMFVVLAGIREKESIAYIGERERKAFLSQCWRASIMILLA